MILWHLEVQDFRGISASVPFGAGLTVLHGPNELGKSTLVEAIRAALFLPTTSQAGNDHVTWGRQTPACVKLTFAHSGKLWCVSKRFGYRKSAELESSDSLDPIRFRRVAEGNNVEGKLRELLAWGIAPPGGRGASSKAESFLFTALLGRQGQAGHIFDANLDDDRDETGRSLVTRALGALDKDPLVASIIDDLERRVEAVWVPSRERFTTAAESPLVQMQTRLRSKVTQLDALRAAVSRGEVIQRDVVRLQDDRERLVGELAVADETWKAAKELEEQAVVRQRLHAEVDEIRRQITEADRLASELATLEARLADSESALAPLRAAEETAATGMAAAQQAVHAAAEAVARATEAAAQSGLVSEATRAQRRAELEARKTAVSARLKEVAEVEEAARAVAALRAQHEAARLAAATAADVVKKAGRSFERATFCQQIANLEAREAAVTGAAGHLADAQKREHDAHERLRAAESEVAVAEERRQQRTAESSSEQLEAAAIELRVLRAIETHIGIAAVRADVEALETRAQRARDLRAGAAVARTKASTIDQHVATRILPTPEQIAAWRELERHVQTEPASAPAAPSVLLPVVASLVGGLAVWAGARFGVDLPASTSTIAGILTSLVLGGLVWVVQRRSPSIAVELEVRTRRRERWQQEVQPSLRRAGLDALDGYEGAIAEVARQRTDAQRLREQAASDELAAGEEERTAAVLEARKSTLAHLESETPVADRELVLARLRAFGGSLDTVRGQIVEQERTVEAIRAGLQTAADAEVRAAAERRDSRRSEREALVADVARAQAALDLAQQQRDTATLSQYRTRLAELGGASGAAISPETAAQAWDAAKTQQTAAATKADELRTRIDSAVAEQERRERALGGALADVRAQTLQDHDGILAELMTWETTATEVSPPNAATLEAAQDEHGRLGERFASAREAFERIQTQRSEAERVAMNISKDVAERRGRLTATNRAALDARLVAVTADPAFQTTGDPGPALQTATLSRDTLRKQLEQCTNSLNHARGQLHLIAGHVDAERLQQLEDAVTFGQAEVLERERTERAALRLLRDIEKVEAERTTHLGRALAGPITDAFRNLTAGRYGAIRLAPKLKTEGIEAGGGQRTPDVLSVGTREQLATLLRLAVAGHLHSTIVLDDQLVHSDTDRLRWFGERLLKSVQENAHQVIVFACRAGDYPSATDDGSVCVLNLAGVVSRS